MQVAMDMRKMAGWKEAKKGDTKADVWLVDGRKKGAIPYAVLGQNGPQLVNYYRGSSALTLKSSMVRTLRSYIREKHLDEEAVGLPMTFIVYPQREQAREQATPANRRRLPRMRTQVHCIRLVLHYGVFRCSRTHSGPSGENAKPSALKKGFMIQQKRAAAAAADERESLLAAHDAELRRARGEGKEANGGPIWIAKASAGGKGQGIIISRDCAEVLQHIDSSSSDTAWVVSRQENVGLSNETN